MYKRKRKSELGILPNSLEAYYVSRQMFLILRGHFKNTKVKKSMINLLL